MELRPDAVIAEKLLLLRPLGQGGMGVVWAARHLSLQTEVAVKFIRPERVSADPTLIARFEREARTTARIAHPHVVRIMDYGTVDGTVPYIVMEQLRGFPLGQLLERGGRLSFATSRFLLHQAGSALESAHELGIVHRDVKPHNVFITEESQGYPLFVKVLDFGVAKMLHAAPPSGSGVLTETGVVVGSAPYMSPEQLEGSKEVDLRSDLWSLGVVLYEALTGAKPFQGASFVAVGAAVLAGRYRPASDWRPDLPCSLDDWFAKVFSLDPGDRFQSAREMLAAFPSPDARLDAIDPHGLASRVLTAHATASTVGNPSPPNAQIGVTGAAAAHERGARPQPRRDASTTVVHGPLAHPSAIRTFLASPSIGTFLASSKARAWPRPALGVAGVSALAALGLSPVATEVVSQGCPADMVLIGGAEFDLGSPADADTPSDETTQDNASRRVRVQPFCLDTTEVTVRAYSSCKACEPPRRTAEFEGLTPNGRGFESRFCNHDDRPDHPMNCVDWFQAKAFCAAMGRRLPTEAEWELAARGPSGRAFPWGEGPPAGDRLNACGLECSQMLTQQLERIGKGPWPAMYADSDSAPSTAPVGRFPSGATPEGVQDLAGNVWEWTASRYCPYPYDEQADCDDLRRVLRGGGWDTTEVQNVRSARRYPSAPTARGKSVGFRCATSP